MNKTKIEWCDYTANPVRGVCRHGCAYCYSNAIHRRFKTGGDVTFHPEVLQAIRAHKIPATVFVGSAHDLFGDWVGSKTIETILHTCFAEVDQRHIFLTKNPARYEEFRKKGFGSN
mgnify:CR=1 FL=1